MSETYYFYWQACQNSYKDLKKQELVTIVWVLVLVPNPIFRVETTREVEPMQ